MKCTVSITFLVLILAGFLLVTPANAAKIIWVAGTIQDSLGVDSDQGFVDILVAAGHEVQRENKTMESQPLTPEQIAVLESGDLVIVSRSTNSGDYNTTSWNTIRKPIINTTSYLSRGNRWQWFDSSDILGGGDSGAPLYKIEYTDHPIFAGIEPDESGKIEVLDGTIGSGNTSLPGNTDFGNGILLASAADTGTVTIAYWGYGAKFHENTEEVAAAPRLLFNCGARENDEPGNLQGLYNLTPVGTQLFLNAVEFMLAQGPPLTSYEENFETDVDLDFWRPNKSEHDDGTPVFEVSQEDGALKVVMNQMNFPDGQMYDFLQDNITFNLTNLPIWSLKIKVEPGATYTQDGNVTEIDAIPFMGSPFSKEGPSQTRQHSNPTVNVPDDGVWHDVFFNWMTPDSDQETNPNIYTNITRLLLEVVKWPGTHQATFWIDDFKVGRAAASPDVPIDITNLDGFIKGSNDHLPWTGPDSDGSPDAERIEKLIDNDVNTKYLVGAEQSWIDYYTTILSNVTSYSITSANDAPERDPNSWLFQGWDTATATWVTLDSVVDQPVWEERFMTKTWTFENDGWYNKYRLTITAINGDTQGLMQIAELELFGGLGEDVVADVTDYADLIKGSNDHLPWTGPDSDGSPDGERIEKLIDNDKNTKYLVGAEESWLDVITPNLSMVTSYSITSANDAPERDPNSWLLQGWDTATATWVTLDSVVDQPMWEERFQTKNFAFENADLWFNKYRLHILAINGDAQGLMQIAELQLFGELGDKVEADITDFVVEVAGQFDDLVWPDGGSPAAEQLPMLVDNNKMTKYLVKAEQSWLDLYTNRLSQVTGYSITSANDVPPRDPNSWELLGWDAENQEWVTIHTVNDQPVWEERFQTLNWSANSSQWFSTYRLNILAINGDTEGLMQIAELQIFGELGGRVDVAYPPTGVETKEMVVTDFTLEQNYPNPFNPSTNIRFALPAQDHVKLTIYDIRGREVLTLADEKMEEGYHSITFDASQIASGIYFYRLKTSNHDVQKKMTFIK